MFSAVHIRGRVRACVHASSVPLARGGIKISIPRRRYPAEHPPNGVRLRVRARSFCNYSRAPCPVTFFPPLLRALHPLRTNTVRSRVALTAATTVRPERRTSGRVAKILRGASSDRIARPLGPLDRSLFIIIINIYVRIHSLARAYAPAI